MVTWRNDQVLSLSYYLADIGLQIDSHPEPSDTPPEHPEHPDRPEHPSIHLEQPGGRVHFGIRQIGGSKIAKLVFTHLGMITI